MSAGKLGRKWIGIDISSFAIDLIKKKRLQDFNIPTKGIPYDFASARRLKEENPFNFESWAINRIPGLIPNTRQVGDRGIDGRGMITDTPDPTDGKQYDRLVLAQVKSGRFSLSGLRDFIHVMDRDNAVIGIYITLDPVNIPEARKEVANCGSISVNGQEYRRLQLWSISDYFNVKPDRLSVLPRLPLMNDPYTGKVMSSDLLSIFD